MPFVKNRVGYGKGEKGKRVEWGGDGEKWVKEMENAGGNKDV